VIYNNPEEEKQLATTGSNPEYTLNGLRSGGELINLLCL
jgi:hypothetical protein